MSLREIEKTSGFFLDTNGDFQWSEFSIWSISVMVLISWFATLGII